MIKEELLVLLGEGRFLFIDGGFFWRNFIIKVKVRFFCNYGYCDNSIYFIDRYIVFYLGVF